MREVIVEQPLASPGSAKNVLFPNKKYDSRYLYLTVVLVLISGCFFWVSEINNVLTFSSFLVL